MLRGTEILEEEHNDQSHWGEKKEEKKKPQKHSEVRRRSLNDITNIINSFKVSVELITLSPDRLRHGARITQPLAVDGPDHEKVDCVGAKTFDGELGGFDVVCHSLPAVAHWLTGMKEPEKRGFAQQTSQSVQDKRCYRSKPERLDDVRGHGRCPHQPGLPGQRHAVLGDICDLRFGRWAWKLVLIVVFHDDGSSWF